MRSLLCVLVVLGCGDDSAALVDAHVADAAVMDALEPDATPAPPGCQDAHARADEALQSLLLKYWNGGAEDLDAAWPGASQGAAYWIFAQAWDAVLDGAERTGRYRGLVETMYLSRDARGWTSAYYDDENWMALALIRAFDLTGRQMYLDRAQMLYADIMAAWDTTCCGARGGGIWWDRAHSQKATASNAGPVITGYRLAARTGNHAYADFAHSVYAYWLANMVDPNTHQVADHIDPTGVVTRWKFTYNEGLMIGAALEAGAPSDARAIADFMITQETQSGILSDGPSGSCSGDCAQFKGIGFRYLAELWRSDPSRAEYAQVLSQSAQAIWSQARSANDLFAVDWAGPPPSSATLAQQSSAVMALNLFATLCGAAPAPAPGEYPAEEAVLHHVGLEATHTGFTGWGYVAGWNADGQGVDFTITVPQAGHYRLDFDYAAETGTAVRQLWIDGAAGTMQFPSTGSWDSWSRASTNALFTAGAHTVSLTFAAGSAAYLNLDRLVVTPIP